MKLPGINLILLLVGVAFSGCSKDNWHAQTLPVTGTLQVNGESHAGIYVILVANGPDVDARGSRPWGVTDSAGNFSLSTYMRGDGCPIGEYLVTVKWPTESAKLTSPDRLYDKFSLPRESKLTVSVTKETSTLPPIVLDDVKFMKEGLGSSETNQGMGVRRAKKP